MGDRANVKIVSKHTGTVYLYTHWSGSELPQTVQQALRRGAERWDDPAYLARIVFCEMIKGEALDGLTGYGISQECGDGEDRVITLNTDEQQVTWAGKKATFRAFASMSMLDRTWAT